MKALVAGWFSFQDGHATAGDVLAGDLVRGWVESAGLTCDVALDPPFRGGVDWRRVEPSDYSHVVFVCGPFARKPLESAFLRRFSNALLFGVDLTMQVPLRDWNPFDFLSERDSSEGANPDVTFLSRRPLVPVIGVCLVEPYPEGWVDVANAAIRSLVGSREVTVVEVDTRLDSNTTGLRTESEVESLLARMDAVVTTRLHGMVLSLKNGVPVVAIDPEPGGAKVRRQAERIGWRTIFDVDRLTQAALSQALDYCLTEEAAIEARSCADRAAGRVDEIRLEFLEALSRPKPPEVARSRVVADAQFLPEPRETLGVTEPAAEGGGSLSSKGKRLAKSFARRTLSAKTRGWARRALRGPTGDEVFRSPRRTTPVSGCFGFDRGLPIDRSYIEHFLAKNAADIRGRVLEVGDDSYTLRFGGSRVSTRDVLHVDPEAPGATVIADLAHAEAIPSDAFDAFICTQTLHLLYDVRAAVRTIHRVLKPGGVVLATFPGISQISHDQWKDTWYWALTPLAARRVFGEVFPDSALAVGTTGNVLAASAFLYGLAAHELSPAELGYVDPAYPCVVTVRAVKGSDGSPGGAG